MIELGKKQTLFIVKSVEFGVYLAEDMHADTKHQVLLPAKQVPAGKRMEIRSKYLFTKIHRIV